METELRLRLLAGLNVGGRTPGAVIQLGRDGQTLTAVQLTVLWCGVGKVLSVWLLGKRVMICTV